MMDGAKSYTTAQQRIDHDPENLKFAMPVRGTPAGMPEALESGSPVKVAIRARW